MLISLIFSLSEADRIDFQYNNAIIHHFEIFNRIFKNIVIDVFDSLRIVVVLVDVDCDIAVEDVDHEG